MSNHVIPQASDSMRLRELIDSVFPGRLANVTANGQTAGNIAFVFTPDLSAGEAATFDDLVANTKGTIQLSPADYALIKAELPAARAFLQNGAPTLAQNSAVTKAIIRVLAAILRDG